MQEPFISIITPVVDLPAWMLRSSIDSVIAQTNQDCELIVAIAQGHDEKTLHELKRYESNERITVVMCDENATFAHRVNEAISNARGEFVGVLNHGDELDPECVSRVKSTAASQTDIDFLYSDEDRINEKGELCMPFFKPDWSLERLRSQNYICHFSLYRAALVEKLGGYRDGFEGSEDYDLALRVAETASRIEHIPEILYHWRILSETISAEKQYVYESAQRAISEHAQRLGWNATVTQTRPEGVYETRRLLADEPLISVIMPTAFARKIVHGRKCFLIENAIRSIMQKSPYKNIEFIIVTNVPGHEDDRQLVSEAAEGKVTFVDKFGPFNFSAQVNYAATFARGSLLLMLNDDTEIAVEESISHMAGFFLEPDVGVVGSLLIYENELIQHAGVVMARPGPTNYLAGFRRTDSNNAWALFCSREVSATTFAAALIDRNVFFAVGGLCESLPNCYNDVDFCAKVIDMGKRIVWTPQSVFYHYESATRDPEVRKFEAEKIFLRWGHFLKNDRYANPNLVVAGNALVPEVLHEKSKDSSSR